MLFRKWLDGNCLDYLLALQIGEHEAVMTRAELRRLMLTLAGGHSAALAMESELVRMGGADA